MNTLHFGTGYFAIPGLHLATLAPLATLLNSVSLLVNQLLTYILPKADGVSFLFEVVDPC